MPGETINLAFFLYPRRHGPAHFVEAARLINARHPRIRASVHSTRHLLPAAAAMLGSAFRPTLTVELDRVRLARPLRGYRLRHILLGKVAELQRLEAAGIPVPRWEEITPETALDPATWGPYVVTKPTNAKRGAYVRIMRTGRVRHRGADELEPGHPGREAPMIAQEFIYTGPMPVCFRVVTYLGRPVVAIRQEGTLQRPLESRYAFKATGGHNIVATAQNARVSLFDDPEIIDLARRVHAVFPDVPTLGTDLVRDVETGKLYVLECNPFGAVWAISHRGGRRMQEQLGVDFSEQFGAVEVIAEASAEAALRLAR
ncbi:MAG: hypothetical protein IT535_13405 [Bauldia sp.]|nr:hypothetical protein [Bauldia sp.]